MTEGVSAARDPDEGKGFVGLLGTINGSKLLLQPQNISKFNAP